MQRRWIYSHIACVLCCPRLLSTLGKSAQRKTASDSTRGAAVSSPHATFYHFHYQVSTLVLGSQDEDFPFSCPPGVHGNDKRIETQLSPVCVGACPAGSICPLATHTPQRAPIQTTRSISRPLLTCPHSHVAQLVRLAHFAREGRPQGRFVRRGLSRLLRTSRRQRSATSAQASVTNLLTSTTYFYY